MLSNFSKLIDMQSAAVVMPIDTQNAHLILMFNHAKYDISYFYLLFMILVNFNLTLEEYNGRKLVK